MGQVDLHASPGSDRTSREICRAAEPYNPGYNPGYNPEPYNPG